MPYIFRSSLKDNIAIYPKTSWLLQSSPTQSRQQESLGLSARFMVQICILLIWANSLKSDQTPQFRPHQTLNLQSVSNIKPIITETALHCIEIYSIRIKTRQGYTIKYSPLPEGASEGKGLLQLLEALSLPLSGRAIFHSTLPSRYNWQCTPYSKYWMFCVLGIRLVKEGNIKRV